MRKPLFFIIIITFFFFLSLCSFHGRGREILPKSGLRQIQRRALEIIHAADVRGGASSIVISLESSSFLLHRLPSGSITGRHFCKPSESCRRRWRLRPASGSVQSDLENRLRRRRLLWVFLFRLRRLEPPVDLGNWFWVFLRRRCWRRLQIDHENEARCRRIQIDLPPRWVNAGLLAVAVSAFLLVAVVHQVAAVKPIPRIRIGEEDGDSPILQESIVREVNSNPNAGWRADMNAAFSNYTFAQFKRLLGVKPLPKNRLLDFPVRRHPESLKVTLPKEFDARSAWSHCSTIGRILDQGHCGSCWAFGAVESLSDRFCIHFGQNISLSVNDLLSCCGALCGEGCDGGYPILAWYYLVQNGVVTEECDPYFDQIGCSHPGCEPLYPTPTCEKKCKSGNQVWPESKHFSVNAYKVSFDQYDIMAELYKNGPVEVAFTVYEDFAHYKSGVYRHITGESIGGHAVKLIGWGTSESGEDYWLLANQWNRGWGDDGYFKIARGRNECGIEEDVVAGLPSPRNLNLISSAVAADAADLNPKL